MQQSDSPLTLDEDALNQWLGNTESVSTSLDLRAVQQMQSLLDLPFDLQQGDELPKLWHWLYTMPLVPLAEIGQDGHPHLGDFMPPVDLPRRMWAGGRLQFYKALTIGGIMQRDSTIKSIKLKHGRTGILCFVIVEHRYSQDGELCLTEEHDIVYRQMPAPDAVTPTPPKPTHNAQWQQTIHPSPVMLYRYSAATFNSHRIHYDREYCREQEGYPGLVFHGPLTATLMLDLAEKNMAKPMKRFSFKAISPLYDTDDFQLCGCSDTADKAQVWAENPDGLLAMEAVADFGDGAES